MRPGFADYSLVERKEFVAANGNSLVTRNEYQIDAALHLDDFAPFQSKWNLNRSQKRLPLVSDFDAIRTSSAMAAVHLVDTSSNDAAGFRYLEFDCGSRMDGRDFSGVHVAEYPGEAIRHSTMIDYESAARVGRCSLMEVSFDTEGTPRKFARLILPVSDSGRRSADRLLVVVRLLECGRQQSDERSGMAESEGVGAGGLNAAPVGGSNGHLNLTPGGLESSLRPSDLVPHVLRRYIDAGQQEFLDDQHILELLLSRSVPEKDARELAIHLIDEFSSLSAVTAMSNERLAEISGLSMDCVADLKVVRELAARMIRQELTKKDLLSDARKAIDYCYARMAHETVEHVRIMFLDQKNHLIKDEALHCGSVAAVPVHPRQIVKRAIVLDAQSIILAHNHPSGDPSPSAADVELTLELKHCSQAVGIRLLDHLIIGRSGHVSLRSMGYLDIDSD